MCEFTCRMFVLVRVQIRTPVCVPAHVQECASLCLRICVCVRMSVCASMRAFAYARVNSTRFLRVSLRCLENAFTSDEQRIVNSTHFGSISYRAIYDGVFSVQT